MRDFATGSALEPDLCSTSHRCGTAVASLADAPRDVVSHIVQVDVSQLVILSQILTADQVQQGSYTATPARVSSGSPATPSWVP